MEKNIKWREIFENEECDSVQRSENVEKLRW